MAKIVNDRYETVQAASAIPAFACVTMDTSSPYKVVSASGASVANTAIVGLAAATVATVGLHAQVQVDGYAKGLAAASLGAGAFVALGIGTSSLVPLALTPAPSRTFAQHIVGVAVENAAQGAIFTVKLERQVL